jgi:7,8-dihydro-6-hydroxymethylpterin-pyrophosphokinase
MRIALVLGTTNSDPLIFSEVEIKLTSFCNIMNIGSAHSYKSLNDIEYINQAIEIKVGEMTLLHFQRVIKQIEQNMGRKLSAVKYPIDIDLLAYTINDFWVFPKKIYRKKLNEQYFVNECLSDIDIKIN